MPYRIRIVDGFRIQSAEQLIVTGSSIIKGLTDNTAFPTPTVDLKAEQVSVDDLSAALAAHAHGGTTSTAEKNNRRTALVAHPMMNVLSFTAHCPLPTANCQLPYCNYRKYSGSAVDMKGM